jgi:hypothetical protein
MTASLWNHFRRRWVLMTTMEARLSGATMTAECQRQVQDQEKKYDLLPVEKAGSASDFSPLIFSLEGRTNYQLRNNPHCEQDKPLLLLHKHRNTSLSPGQHIPLRSRLQADHRRVSLMVTIHSERSGHYSRLSHRMLWYRLYRRRIW